MEGYAGLLSLGVASKGGYNEELILSPHVHTQGDWNDPLNWIDVCLLFVASKAIDLPTRQRYLFGGSFVIIEVRLASTTNGMLFFHPTACGGWFLLVQIQNMECSNTAAHQPIPKGVPKKGVVRAICGTCYKPVTTVKIGYQPATSSQPPYTPPRADATILANQSRQWQRDNNRKDLVQPYNKNGTINHSFAKLYPEQTKQMLVAEKNVIE